jgi:hypothetical protein
MVILSKSDDCLIAQGPAERPESAPHEQIALFRMPEKTPITDQNKIDVDDNMEQLVVRVEFESQVQEVTIDLRTATEKLTKNAELPEDVGDYYTPEELEKIKRDDEGRTVKIGFCFDEFSWAEKRLTGIRKGVGVWDVDVGFYTNPAPMRRIFDHGLFRVEVRSCDKGSAKLLIETFRQDSEQGGNKAILKVVKIS